MNLKKQDNMLRERLLSIDPTQLHLIIYPTMKCPFRCVYCYEDHNGPTMSLEIVESIKKFLMNRLAVKPSLKFLKVSFFGGEPVQPKIVNIVFELSNFFLELSKKHCFRFLSGVTTNGYYLDLDNFQKMYSLNILDYQITLDGKKEYHDKVRVIANRGTFDTIWSNLIKIKQLPKHIKFRIVIRLHYSPANYLLLSEFIRELDEVFLSDKRFHIFLKSISHLGGPNDTDFPVFAAWETPEIEQELLNSITNKEQIYNYFRSDICYASKLNSFAIRSDGKLNKCTVDLESELNTVGHINKDGTLSLKQEHLKYWARGLQSNDSKILKCPLSA